MNGPGSININQINLGRDEMLFCLMYCNSSFMGGPNLQKVLSISVEMFEAVNTKGFRVMDCCSWTQLATYTRWVTSKLFRVFSYEHIISSICMVAKHGLLCRRKLFKNCHLCLSKWVVPPSEPLHQWQWASQSWTWLHLDMAGPFLGHMFLVLIDVLLK